MKLSLREGIVAVCTLHFDGRSGYDLLAIIQRIRQKVIDRNYYLSSHAEDEMWADQLERPDIENAILKGRIQKRMTRDLRGTRYRIEGPANDGRLIHIICRFVEDGSLLIITVYALTEEI